MDIPCRLWRLADGQLTDHLAPGQSGTLVCGAGTWLPEDEAQRQGITRFLARRAAESKAVPQAAVEDKAVSLMEVENKGGEDAIDPRRAQRRPSRGSED